MEDNRYVITSATLNNLYIPHGSDGRDHALILLLSFPCFISHMVQMEEVPEDEKEEYLRELYIPHGSDGSCFLFHLDLVFFLLYIPHGSDGRKTETTLACASECFISHMVQMEVYQLLYLQAFTQTLYPTWFRWKKNLFHRPWCAFIALYPTWFRWKEVEKLLNKKKVDVLYIPHGSDGSNIIEGYLQTAILYIPHGSDGSLSIQL